jgi:RNA polymerase sigma-70 factor (ECF subfamily)
MSPATLTETFLRRRRDGGLPWSGATDELEEILAAHVEAARAAWPELAPASHQLVDHLALRLPSDADVAALRQLRAADLHIARLAASGDERAIAAFEARYFGEVDLAAARMRAAADQAGEIKQRLRRILFVRDGDRPPAAESYAGRGDLRGWVRVTAVRELHRLLARENRELRIADDAFLEVLSPADDPELGYLRERYRRELGEAIGAAIAGATPRERDVLRYHILDGLNIEQIGKLYGVHRATVARWIAAAREGIFARAREELSRRFGIAADEVDSIVRLVQSRLDVSMERVLEG